MAYLNLWYWEHPDFIVCSFMEKSIGLKRVFNSVCILGACIWKWKLLHLSQVTRPGSCKPEHPIVPRLKSGSTWGFQSELLALLQRDKNFIMLVFLWENLILLQANNEGADKPEHLCNLFSVFIHSQESVIAKLATCPSLSVAEQAGMSLTRLWGSKARFFLLVDLQDFFTI